MTIQPPPGHHFCMTSVKILNHPSKIIQRQSHGNWTAEPHSDDEEVNSDIGGRLVGSCLVSYRWSRL